MRFNDVLFCGVHTQGYTPSQMQSYVQLHGVQEAEVCTHVALVCLCLPACNSGCALHVLRPAPADFLGLLLMPP